MQNAGLFPFEYDLMALQMSHASGTATTDEADALFEIVKKITETTHDSYQELWCQSQYNMTPDVKEQLENLYMQNYAARSVLFDLFHLGQQIRNPNSIYRTWSQLPTMNEIKPDHRNL